MQVLRWCKIQRILVLYQYVKGLVVGLDPTDSPRVDEFVTYLSFLGL